MAQMAASVLFFYLFYFPSFGSNPPKPLLHCLIINMNLQKIRADA
jgi:hypothetical protein